MADEQGQVTPSIDVTGADGGSDCSPTTSLLSGEQRGRRSSSGCQLADARAFLDENADSDHPDLSAHHEAGDAFGVNPAQLNGLVDPKNAYVLQALGGPEHLAKLLVTDLKKGLIDSQLSKEEVAVRARMYGHNSLPQRKSKSLWSIMWMTLNDKVLIILIVAAIVSLGLGLYQTFCTPPELDPEGRPVPRVDWVEGVAILLAVAIVTIVGSVNDWQKERQFEKLNRKKEDRKLDVIRNGQEVQVDIADLLVGDIVMVQPGDVLAVDGIVLESNDLKCDESSVTGETDTLRKYPAHVVLKRLQEDGADYDPHSKKVDCMMLSGAKVLEGSGCYLVTAVGENSIHGRTLMSLQHGTEITPLQEKLNRVADSIAKFGIISAALLFLVLVIRFLYIINTEPGKSMPLTRKSADFLNIFIVSITIVVVAVPEGLPLAVTLALAFATTRMIKDNCLVRVLRSCETMGGATIICSDKTGTLTQNRMTVVAGVAGRIKWSGDDKPGFVDTAGDLLRDSICVNSSVYEAAENGGEELIGSKTEAALVGFARRFLGVECGSLKKYRDSRPIVRTIPFDSGRKYMITIIKHGKGYRLLIKGAAESLLRQSTSVWLPDKVEPLQNGRDIISEVIDEYASHALRVIAIAYKDFETDKDLVSIPTEEIEATGLTLVGFFGIQDPLRPGVEHAVDQCKHAGVVVCMVTGDNVRTARAIAINAHIIAEHDKNVIVMEGPEFRKLNNEELDRVIPRLRVLARSSPQDKRTLVGWLQSHGETVAVTGDGTNDGPALRLADVGFSMGITGTEVAKEASDIIIMDDNFASIVNAMKWGRTVNDSVKKFLQFQLTVNVTAVILTFISAVTSKEGQSVLTAVQLLWVNLIMDTLAALALATDAPTDDVLDRKPDNRAASLITPTMWKMICGQSLYQLIVTLILVFHGKDIFGAPKNSQDETRLNAMVFNTFVWCQFFNMFVNRRIDNHQNIFKGLSRNMYFPAIVVLIAVTQVLVMFYGGIAFSIRRQTLKMWELALLLGFGSVPVGALIRLIPDKWFIRLYPRKIVIAASKLCDAVGIGLAILFYPAIWLIEKFEQEWTWCWNCLPRREPTEDQESLLQSTRNSLGDPRQYNWMPAIQQSLDELALLQRIRGGRLRQLKWVKPQNLSPNRYYLTLDDGDSSGRTSRASSLTAFMAPIVVGGAVGGWNPQLIEEEDTSESQPRN